MTRRGQPQPRGHHGYGKQGQIFGGHRHSQVLAKVRQRRILRCRTDGQVWFAPQANGDRHGGHCSPSGTFLGTFLGTALVPAALTTPPQQLGEQPQPPSTTLSTSSTEMRNKHSVINQSPKGAD